jgi:hypothetical protein
MTPVRDLSRLWDQIPVIALRRFQVILRALEIEIAVSNSSFLRRSRRMILWPDSRKCPISSMHGVHFASNLLTMSRTLSLSWGVPCPLTMHGRMRLPPMGLS